MVFTKNEARKIAGNNVYGFVICPDGIQPIYNVISEAYREQGVNVSIKKGQSLRFENDALDFESTPLSGSKHLLNGWVDSELEKVVSFTQDISALLASIGIEHTFEVYDEKDELHKTIPEK